ncbi:pre-mRNA-processing protein 40A-like [Zingiber officinale]|uniref:pre-mRNA-processing protein 40A-like n=1 Tax=Zingiber officinale TaxID=94328 RepID=UPI001C4B2DF8|nr:pre-mRNA-processing protein 40A-like [Zingiber officinale]XP_042470247.1 pre-mRNA-processing protein 40A-like [Zingiber officinale]XP_042470248.1 pre-mRNA-processing protein 40A-like [Zingiber officinale]XP_042470249.1 pre-mRNA-processing protein 40A-like [Zingiber officinale]XP_042470250.1 pre-mRNA-processing protein 40A-like [Zingiber officinale]XP_042470251.1 pre-mRNA-processing protein 40A-like [Zingiber officinale]
MASNPQASGTLPPRPAVLGSAGPPQNFAPPMPMLFTPLVPPQTNQFVPSQQFRPVGQGMPGPNVAIPNGQTQMPHFPQSTLYMPPMSGQPGQMPPSSQAIPLPYFQASRPIASGPLPSQPNAQVPGNLPSFPSMGMHHSSSYTFVTSYGQAPNNVISSSQYQPASQMQIPAPSVAQAWPGPVSITPVTPIVQTVHQPSATVVAPQAQSLQPSSNDHNSSDWHEHTSPDGRRYYYNKKTKQSVWEKPHELMTPVERADASTDWKEFTAADGRKYYYNKVTKQSKWTMPDELKLAREQSEKTATQLPPVEIGTPAPSVALTIPSTETSSMSTSLPTVTEVVSTSSINPSLMESSSGAETSMGINSSSSVGKENEADLPNLHDPANSAPDLVHSSATAEHTSVVVDSTATEIKSNQDNNSSLTNTLGVHGETFQEQEEPKEPTPLVGKDNVRSSDDKAFDEQAYANKLEAKNAFKALLESANVQSDWTWEQAMRVIINDKRYGSLRTLGERKQAFNEYLGQRKKQETEERRIKQKKSREDFVKMLEECKDLTSSTRWSKAIIKFEDDERFCAVERPREREDLFESYITELQKKERTKAADDHKRNIMEYREFLDSCDFIKANSQWRKVQDRLEGDERCYRLEKIDRLEIFQEYVRDLEKEEEEKRKIQKEQIRRAERKNRDEFRKLMEDHVASGVLTAKTQWRDYFSHVKDLAPYLAVASNSSGSTAKDLFEDVVEELEKQYLEDRSQIKDAVKIGKITLASSWTFEQFKAAVAGIGSLKGIPEINLKLAFDELLERLQEKEEKEAKKRQRLADSFSDLLYSIKELTAHSNWEESKLLFLDSQEYWSIDDDNFARELFEAYIAQLKEKLKEKDRKREEEKLKKEKEREERRKEKEKEKERERAKQKGKDRARKDEAESDDADLVDDYGSKDRKRDKEKERKHRKHHHSHADEISSGKDEEDEHRKSKRHSSDRKKSRKHSHATDSDTENRHKRHRKDRDGSRRNGSHEELEDGEVGEDGEIC